MALTGPESSSAAVRRAEAGYRVRPRMRSSRCSNVGRVGTTHGKREGAGIRRISGGRSADIGCDMMG
jgi:hypothetical protein